MTPLRQRMIEELKRRNLPTLLSQDEVRAMLSSISHGRDRVVVTVAHAYAHACGLRVSELAGPRVKDIDGARKLLHVHAGKGRKDRPIPLSDSLLMLLRNDWRVPPRGVAVPWRAQRHPRRPADHPARRQRRGKGGTNRA